MFKNCKSFKKICLIYWNYQTYSKLKCQIYNLKTISFNFGYYKTNYQIYY